MRAFRFVPPCCAAVGPPLAAWGGYGLGVGAAGPAWTGPDLLAAGLTLAGVAAGVAAAALARPGSATQSRRAAFAADAAVLDALAPALAAHPRGLACLKALAELLFEVHHPAAEPQADTPADRAEVMTEGGVR